MVGYPRGSVRRQFVVAAPTAPPTVYGEHIKRRHEAFLTTVRDVLEYHGWRVFAIFDSRKCPPGYPDVTAVHPEHGALWIECKTGDATLTPDQRLWRDDLLATGQRWYLLRPTDGDLLDAIARGVFDGADTVHRDHHGVRDRRHLSAGEDAV